MVELKLLLHRVGVGCVAELLNPLAFSEYGIKPETLWQVGNKSPNEAPCLWRKQYSSVTFESIDNATHSQTSKLIVVLGGEGRKYCGSQLDVSTDRECRVHPKNISSFDRHWVN